MWDVGLRWRRGSLPGVVRLENGLGDLYATTAGSVDPAALLPLASQSLEFGRGDWIRTSDPLNHIQVRYQAALRPDLPDYSTLVGSLPRGGVAPRRVCRGLRPGSGGVSSSGSAPWNSVSRSCEAFAGVFIGGAAAS